MASYEIYAISSDQPLQGPALDISGPDMRTHRNSHEDERQQQVQGQPEDLWAGDSARVSPPPSPPDARDQAEVELCLRSLLDEPAAIRRSLPPPPPAQLLQPGQAAPVVWPSATGGNRPGPSCVQSDPGGWPSLAAPSDSRSARGKAAQHGRAGAATSSARSRASPATKQEEEEEERHRAPLGRSATEWATTLMGRLGEEDKLRPAMDILSKVCEARGALVYVSLYISQRGSLSSD